MKGAPSRRPQAAGGTHRQLPGTSGPAVRVEQGWEARVSKGRTWLRKPGKTPKGQKEADGFRDTLEQLFSRTNALGPELPPKAHLRILLGAAESNKQVPFREELVPAVPKPQAAPELGPLAGSVGLGVA